MEQEQSNNFSDCMQPLQEELESLRAAESEAKKALDLVDAEQKELNKGVEELLAQREEARKEHQAAYEELKKLRQQAAQRVRDTVP
jgi:predicted  nucleic acid-binding Zn-ribbon protein